MRPQSRYQKGDKIGGRYLVHQALMGGMGEVYLCLDLRINQPIALKTFQARYLVNQKLHEAFVAEASIWIALGKHPNIVRCFSVGALDDQPFMFLEWINNDESHGINLRSWLLPGALDLRSALEFAIDICRGLLHAGQKQPGIVHRDLKPENLLVAQGRITKITDFGLAKIVAIADLESLGTTRESNRVQNSPSLGGKGTPHYMAPEQWRGEELDARTDIYAFGCILYEMLAGRMPFEATTLDGLRRQHLEAAIPVLNKFSDLNDALNNLLSCCLAKRNDERFATVDDLFQHLSLIYQQKFSEAPKTISLNEEFSATDYAARGDAYSELQRYEEALADYAKVIELDSTLVSVFNKRGVVYQKMGRYEQALQDLNQLIQLLPNYAPAYLNRANTYISLNRNEAALENYTRAIQLNPNYAQAYSNRANLYLTLNHYEKAVLDFSRAIELNPNWASNYHSRGITYMLMEKDDEALADFNRAIQLNPNDPNYHADYGNINMKLERFNEAIINYTHSIQLNPSNALAYNYRGFAYSRLLRHDDALEDLNRAIVLDSFDATAYFNRGLIYRELGRHNDALADYTHAIQLDPKNPQAYLSRGILYREHQQYDSALADLNNVLQIDPGNVDAYADLGLIAAEREALPEALQQFEKVAQLGDPNGAKLAVQVEHALMQKGNQQQGKGASPSDLPNPTSTTQPGTSFQIDERLDTVEDRCTIGERADELSKQGLFEEARAYYLMILRSMEKTIPLDVSLLGKLTLGLLLTYVRENDIQSAHRLWTSSMNEIFGIGIWALENGQVSPHDTRLYFLICAHLHSLGLDREKAVAAVNSIMRKVCDDVVANEPELLPLVINNWKQHFMEIFEGTIIPEEHIELVREQEARLGRVVPVEKLDFPGPSKWMNESASGDENVLLVTSSGDIKLLPATAVQEEIANSGRKPVVSKKSFWEKLFGT